MCNNAWRLCFQEAYLIHLPTLKSNHKPLLLQLDSSARVNRNKRPFRFMASWLADESFYPIIKEAWKDSNNWQQAVQDFQAKVEEWNFNCFGNIFQKKRRLMARMEGVNRKLNMGANRYLSRLLQKLGKEYFLILLQEELFWRQKARCDWVRFGDINTKFFHLAAIVRRKRNKIEALIRDNGELVMDDHELSTTTVDYFKSLYTATGDLNNLHTSVTFPTLSNASLMEIEAEFTDLEIKDVVFCMGTLKVPGPDGLQPIFYHS